MAKNKHWKDEHNQFEQLYKCHKITKYYTGWDFRVLMQCWPYNGMATLTGFSYKEMYGHFYGDKKGDCYNKVTKIMIIRQASTLRKMKPHSE